MRVVLALGSLLGRAFYVVDGPHRRRAVRNIHAAFPLRSARGVPRHRARDVLALRPAADGAVEVQHDVAGADARARRRSRGEERVVPRTRAGEGRPALHRAFRLLGNQRARARAGASADVGARASARQPAAAPPARIDAEEDGQLGDLPARRDPARAARARSEPGGRGADRSAHPDRGRGLRRLLQPAGRDDVGAGRARAANRRACRAGVRAAAAGRPVPHGVRARRGSAAAPTIPTRSGS